MELTKYHLCLMSGSYAIVKYFRDEYNNLKEEKDIFSITFEYHYVSVIYREDRHRIYASQEVENGYKMFRIVGVVEFDVSGLLFEIIRPLAKIDVSVLVISSFDTDYILVKNGLVSKVKKEWKNLGFNVVGTSDMI